MKDSKNLSQQILNTNKSNSNNSCSKFMTNTVVRIPAGIPSPKVSLFENMTSVVPIKEISLWEFLLSSDYQDIVHIYRETQDPAVRKEIKKSRLPCVTVSGIFDTRARKRLGHRHSHYICVDIDGKDNPGVKGRWPRAKELLAEKFSSLCYAGLSVGGNGLCLVFRIAYPERHRAQYFALINEIRTKIHLYADSTCCDVIRLRVASYDPEPFFNPNAIPYLNLINKDYGVPCKNDRSASMDVDTKMRAYACIKIISDRQIDITCGYKVWRAIGQALANEFGPEEGRRLFHLVSQWHSDYYPTECDRLFDWCIANHDFINISTFFHYCREYNITFK